MYKLLLLLSILAILLSCGEDENCYKDYAIDFPLETSLQDSFDVGDTIWYRMKLPNILLDNASGELIDFSSFDLFYRMSFAKIDTSVGFDATHLFDVHIDSGNVVSAQYGGGLNIYFHSTSQKVFNVGFIPKTRGTFFSEFRLDESFSIGQYFEPGCWGSGSKHPGLQITNTPCKEQMYNGTSITVNNDSLNFHLVNGICQTSYGYTICYTSYTDFKRGCFAFRVK